MVGTSRQKAKCPIHRLGLKAGTCLKSFIHLGLDQLASLLLPPPSFAYVPTWVPHISEFIAITVYGCESIAQCPKQFDPSSYGCIQTYILHTYLPLTIIAFTLLYDVTISVGAPRPIRNALEWISTPFRNFLRIEDLDETNVATKTRITLQPWKLKLFVALPLLQFLLNVSLLAYLMVQDKHADAMRHLLLTTSWVN